MAINVDVARAGAPLLNLRGVTDVRQPAATASQKDELGMLGNLLAGSSAPMTQQQKMRRDIGSLFGVDTRSPVEKLREQLAGIDMTSAAGLQQGAQFAKDLKLSAQAIQLNTLASQKQREEQAILQQEKEKLTNEAMLQTERAGYSSLVFNSPTLSEEQKNAFSAIALSGGFDGKVGDLLKAAYPSSDGRFSVVGNTVWDNQKGTWADGASPTDVASAKGEGSVQAGSLSDALPGFDSDNYDPKSVSLATSAYNSAATPEEKADAVAKLKPKARVGEEWRTINGKDVLYPVTGEPKREADRTIAATNGARNTALNGAKNFIDVADGILTDISSGKTSAGAAASVLGYVPGTVYWNQRVSVDTLKANLGIDALFEARANSANGSSGFGQLTQMELKRLEDQVRSLSLAQTEEQFIDNLSELRTIYADIVEKDGGEMTIEDYIGVTRQEVVQTSSGNYTVEELP